MSNTTLVSLLAYLSDSEDYTDRHDNATKQFLKAQEEWKDDLLGAWIDWVSSNGGTSCHQRNRDRKVTTSCIDPESIAGEVEPAIQPSQFKSRKTRRRYPLEADDDGYPILPPAETLQSVTGREPETILRTFFNMSYGTRNTLVASMRY